MSMPPPYNQPTMGSAPGGMPPPAAAPMSGPRPRGTKTPTRQRSRTYLLIFIILAVTAGLLLFIGSGIGKSGVYVLRAKQSIPALATLDNNLFDVDSVPKDFLVDGAITGSSPEAVRRAARLGKATSQYPIDKGAQLTSTAVTTSADLYKDLGPDERLVSVSANVSRAIAGQLRAGDRVDLIAVASEEPAWSSTILENVEIISVALAEDQINRLADDQVSAASDGSDPKRQDKVLSDPVPGIYTLRVKANMVNTLTLVDQLSTVYLVYRTADAEPSASLPVTLKDVVCNPVNGTRAAAPSLC